jgi:hypothetical protein
MSVYGKCLTSAFGCSKFEYKTLGVNHSLDLFSFPSEKSALHQLNSLPFSEFEICL